MTGSYAEKSVIKEQWYNLTPYKDEISKYISERKDELGRHSNMLKNYNILYRSIFSGAENSDKERYTCAKEMFNVYKAAIIEGCIPGYSALMDIEGRNPESVLLAPEVKSAMIEQFKSILLVEKLSDQVLLDWITKGEAAVFIKLKETTEKYREKEVLSDAETGEDLIQFKVETGVTYEDIEIEVIDPLDLYIDAVDYKNNPKSCPKIIRTFISPRELLTDKTNFPMLTEADKKAIIQKYYSRDKSSPYVYTSSANATDITYSQSSEKQIEVLTFRGDYVTKDAKLLTNIKAITVEGYMAYLDYEKVNTLQLIYAPYIIDRETHRGVSPLCSTIPLNKLANKCIDLFISNLDEVANPILMYSNESIPKNELKTFRQKRELQWNDSLGGGVSWFNPPEISPNGMALLNVLLNQNKDTMGVNNYISGDMSGSVRTAQESQILFQKANARMRVETDVFSYKFLLPLITSFYAFNRELALAAKHPLKDIYAIPNLMISISTGASKADKEGERMRLMEMLNLPIFQMIFSNLNPQQVVTAVRYLMSKADLKDVDNLLELFDKDGNPLYPVEEEEVNPPVTEQPQDIIPPEEVPMDNGEITDEQIKNGTDIIMQAINNKEE